MKKTAAQNNSEKFKIFGEAYAGISVSHRENMEHFEQYFVNQNEHMYEEVAATSALVRTVDEVVLKVLPTAQKFYLPYATDIINSKDFENDETLNKLRLPYSEIAILTESDYIDTTKPLGEDKEYIGSRITVAVSPDSVYWEELEENLLLANVLFGSEDAIDRESIICAVFNVAERSCVAEGLSKRKWIIYPGCIILTREPKLHRVTGKPSVRSAIVGTQYENTASYYVDVQSNITNNTFDVMNLCLLLALKNIEQQETEETVSSKKRRRQKNLKDYMGDTSYKVLVVKGEVWDGNNVFEDIEEDENGNKKAYRSHHRRGHIKRRKTGNYWWSSTVVHGNKPGFVEKDYELKPQQV